MGSLAHLIVFRLAVRKHCSAHTIPYQVSACPSPPEPFKSVNIIFVHNNNEQLDAFLEYSHALNKALDERCVRGAA